MDAITFIGTIGATLILISFVMNQLHKWKDDYLVYDLLNMLGGSIMVIYAMMLQSWPFAALNIIWTALSLRDFFQDLDRNRKKDNKHFISKWLK